MRGKASVAAVIVLAVQSVCAFADNCVFPPNPVGEALYRQQLNRELPLPISIIIVAFLAAWIVRKFNKAGRMDARNDPTELAGQNSLAESNAPAHPEDPSDTCLQEAGTFKVVLAITPAF